MLYRLKGSAVVVVSVGGADHILDPTRTYDDENATDGVVLVAMPERFMALVDVEQATAAPGERRNVRRPRG